MTPRTTSPSWSSNASAEAPSPTLGPNAGRQSPQRGMRLRFGSSTALRRGQQMVGSLDAARRLRREWLAPLTPVTLLTGAEQHGVVGHRVPRRDDSDDSKCARQEPPQSHVGALPATIQVEPTTLVTRPPRRAYGVQGGSGRATRSGPGSTAGTGAACSALSRWIYPSLPGRSTMNGPSREPAFAKPRLSTYAATIPAPSAHARSTSNASLT